MYFVKIDQETSGKERDLPISSMEPTSSMSKVLTEEWKIFFFVVLFSVGNIRGLFSRLVNLVLNQMFQIQLSTSFLRILLWIRGLIKIIVSKSLYWKQSKWVQHKFLLLFFKFAFLLNPLTTMEHLCPNIEMNFFSIFL